MSDAKYLPFQKRKKGQTSCVLSYVVLERKIQNLKAGRKAVTPFLWAKVAGMAQEHPDLEILATTKSKIVRVNRRSNSYPRSETKTLGKSASLLISMKH